MRRSSPSPGTTNAAPVGIITTMALTTEVLLFARYADEFGAGSVTVSVPEPATAGDLLAAVRRLPGAERLPPSPRIAVNQRFVDPGDLVVAGDEVAIIPPVAGG